MTTIKVGTKVKVSPDLTGEDNWIDAIVTEVKTRTY